MALRRVLFGVLPALSCCSTAYSSPGCSSNRAATPWLPSWLTRQEFVGPLLVLPLCFGGLLRPMWRRGDSRTDDESAVTIGQRWAPVLLGLGITSWVFGQSIFTFYEWGLRQPPPFPSLADVGYLSVYPFLLLGILLLPSRPMPVALRTRIALDGLMIMTAAVTFSWYFILGPVMQQGTETMLAKVVSSAYPLADFVLIACLIILASRPGSMPPTRRSLLALGLGPLVIADSNFAYRTLHEPMPRVRSAMLAGRWAYMLIALGAFAVRLAPSGQRHAPDEQGDTPRSASLSPGSECGPRCCRTPRPGGRHPRRLCLAHVCREWQLWQPEFISGEDC